MAELRANGVTITFDRFGVTDASPLLLINGLGAQMTGWAPAFCEMLASRGFHVIRFDNRDAGLSTHFVEAGIPDMAAIATAVRGGMPAPVPYDLSDMADDTAAILDALGITKAHVVGVSMGGMIAQLVAAEHPDKVLSLTSIMSDTGNQDGARPTPEAMAVLAHRPPHPSQEDAYMQHMIASARVTGSPAYPFDEMVLRANLLANIKRCYEPTGFARQVAAIVASGDRRAKLRTITAPTMVVHGEVDPLIPVEGGHDTAANISGAELVVIPGMGHDLPVALYNTIIDLIVRVAARAQASA